MPSYLIVLGFQFETTNTSPDRAILQYGTYPETITAYPPQVHFRKWRAIDIPKNIWHVRNIDPSTYKSMFLYVAKTGSENTFPRFL